MQTVQGDTAALVAATLVQAEFANRPAPQSQMERMQARFSDKRAPIVAAYRYYLELVTTGIEPARTTGADSTNTTHDDVPEA